MDPRLRGSQLPCPKVISKELSQDTKEQEGFSEVQTFYPGMGVVCNLKNVPEEDLWLDHQYRLRKVYEPHTTKTSGLVNLQIEKNTPESGVEIQDISGFRKLTHLLDPVRWLQGKYSLPKHSSLPWHQDSWEATWNKLQDPMNQAYVEAMATYAFSRLREANITPHFHLFYGSLCAKADTYAYNITDSYMSFRHARWFWAGQEKQMFRLWVDDETPEEIKDAIFQQPEELDDSSDEEIDDSHSELSQEELSGLECDITDAKSIHSANGSAFESVSEEETKTEEDESEETEDTDDDEDLEIYAEIKNFPVMMMFTECSKGTMDDLLDDFEEVGCEPGTDKWELTWKAWIFQVIAALCVGQHIFGFTHNDLHSNNIVWSPTDVKYLYYKTNEGLLFKVPTFGKIFRIIDFGRSIFTINDHFFYSDDFKKGNDAAEQFNFGELYDPSEPQEVHPNPSFDLCRFTVSVFESLFPESPSLKKNGKILSQEPDLVIKETNSELYNTMWKWLLCDDGHNVLMDPDGSERYPDFDLYKVITSQVHGAVPCEQVTKPLFACFKTKETPKDQVYSLYC